MITLKIDTDGKHCGSLCPFKNTATDKCLLFNEQIVGRPLYDYEVEFTSCEECQILYRNSLDLPTE